MDIGRTLATRADAAKAELQLVREALSHPTQKGTALETSLRRLLRRYLPRRIGITEGVVISSDGFESRQMDLILYDKADSPRFFDNGYTRVVPIEYVYAVVEVKTCIDEVGIEQALAAQRQVKAEAKYFQKRRGESYSYHAYGREWVAPPIFSFLFAFECKLSDQGLFQKYLEMHKTCPINQCIDVIYVNSVGLFARSSTDLGLDSGVGDCKSVAWVKDNPMFYFLGLLSILASDWRIRETPEIYRYFRTAPPSGSSQPIAPQAPQHKQLVSGG